MGVNLYALGINLDKEATKAAAGILKLGKQVNKSKMFGLFARHSWKATLSSQRLRIASFSVSS